MSLKKIHDQQPTSFEFSKDNLEIVNGILKKYPEERKKRRSNAFAVLSTKTK